MCKNVRARDNPKLLYNPVREQLMILGCDDSNEVWTSHIETCEWKLNREMKMPHCANSESEYDALLVNDIVFVFYFPKNYHDYTEENDIWWLDLLNKTWYKSIYNVSSGLSIHCYVMKSKNGDDIHILESGYDETHFKLNFHDLSSMELVNAQRDYYNPLLNGYVKEQEKGKLILRFHLH